MESNANPNIFFLGCGCPPPPPCFPPIQLPRICLPPPPPLCLPTINLNPCGRKKRETDEDKEELEVEDNKVCNDLQLKTIMTENMHGTAAESKMRIVEAAEEQLGGQFTVICSSGAFSYLSTTTTFCLKTHNGMNCYAFRTDANLRKRKRH